jgi:HlyD family secretion protein
MENSIIEESKKARRKSFWRFLFNKKIIIVIVFFIVICGGGYYYFIKSKSTDEIVAKPQEWTMKKDDLQINVESDGKVVAKDGVELSFSVSGDTLEVTNVYVKEGQQVKKGDKIASVKTNNLQYDLTKAYASYQATLANYNETMSGATSKEIADAENSIEQAKISLDQTKSSLEKTKISGENKISDAEQALTDAKKKLTENKDELSSKDVKDAYESLVDTIKSINISLRDILVNSDKILGIDNESINDEFEFYLGAKNTSALSFSQSSYSEAKNKLSSLNSSALSMSYNSSYSDIDLASDISGETLNKFELHLYYMQQLLDGTITAPDFTQSELDSLKSNISSSRSSVNTKISSLNSSLKAVNDAKDGLDDYVTDYNNAVKALADAKVEAEQDDLSAESSLRAKEISLKQAQANLEDIKAPLSASELASLRSSLTSAAISVDKARSDLEQATLTSPIDGEIALLNYKVGDIILTSESKAVVSIINKNTLFIEANIEESDINKIVVGQKVNATFEAADGLKLKGEVSFISLTSETSNNGVVTYLVRVIFSNTEENQIREGMTASISFVTSGVENVLVAPVSAIKNVGGKPSVEFKDGQWLPVKTGFTDGKYVEITSGLSEGDIILY